MYLNTADSRIPLQPNDVVQITPDKRYIIDKYLAGGGFAMMYLAHQEGSGRYVALKELYPRQVEDGFVQRLDDGRILIWNPFSDLGGPDDEAMRQELRQYFQREVELTRKAGTVYNARGQQVQQNNLDVLQVEGPMTDTRGNLYLAVDTYQGESLRDFLERGFVRDKDGNVESNQFLSDLIQILAGTAIRLSVLHDQVQMYHLDLSPDNIYLACAEGNTRRQPFIIDYGSAFDIRDTREHIRHRYTVNPFSAPEILALADNPDPGGFYRADESSDTYALAAILFYAATGRIFTPQMRICGDSWKEQIFRAYSAGLNQRPEAGSFAACLIEFFERALSAGQNQRYRSATELLSALNTLSQKYEEYGNLLPLVPGDELMSYLVLEKHPLYRYRSADGDIHVLCLGNGTFVKRMILSLISCGQIIGSHLHIHVVSKETGADFREALLASAPMLADFSNLCCETENSCVTFHYEQAEDLLDPDTCRRVLRNHGDVRYVLISLGKNSRNVRAVNLYARQLSGTEPAGGGKIILNYYSSEDAANNAALRAEDICLPEWLETDAFGDDLASYTRVQRELGMRTIRLAHLYNKLGDPRISLAETARNLAADAYAQRSSCATALHLKYKLAGVGADPDGSLEDIIRVYHNALQGSTYGRLLKNEHNRWMMYMVSDQYRHPTTDQLRQYGFSMADGKFNAAWKTRVPPLHPCLVPCDDGGIRLSPVDWETYTTEEQIRNAPYDELDKTSLLLHMLAGEKCRAILAGEELELLFSKIADRLNDAIARARPEADTETEAAGTTHGLENLRKLLSEIQDVVCSCAQGLQYADDCHRLTALQDCFAAMGIGISEEITLLKQKLSVFREYDRCRDYKDADETIIRNLLWLLYADSDFTLVKLCGRTIADNITAPLVLEPRNLVYAGLTRKSEWEDFLRSQGYCGQIFFQPGSAADLDTACRQLQAVVAARGGRCVIDVTGADEMAVVAAYRLCFENGDVSMVRSLPDGWIENVFRFGAAPVYTLRSSLRADDIFRLYGATRLPGERQYMEELGDLAAKLWELYSNYKNDWGRITAFFQSRGSNTAELFAKGVTIQPDTEWQSCSYTADAHKWTALNVNNVFGELEEKGLLRELRVTGLIRGRVQVSFLCPVTNQSYTFFNAVKNFFLYKLPEAFAPFRCELSGTPEAGARVSIRTGYLVEVREQYSRTYPDTRNKLKPMEYPYDQMYPVLKEMEGMGLIADLKIFSTEREPVRISFVYTNLAVRDCLIKEGNILELFIWYEGRRTRFFDHVQSNFFFSWKEGIRNELDVILTRGLTSLIVSAKTAKFSKEHLYEIKYLTDHFSLNSKPVIVYSSSLAFENGRITDDLTPVKERASAMGVYLIDLNGLDCSLGEKLRRIAAGQDRP